MVGLLPMYFPHLFNRSPSTKLIIWLSDKDAPLSKEQIRRFLTDWQVYCQCIAHICSTDLSLPERVQSTHLRVCSMIFLISIYLNYPTVQFLFWIFFFSDCLMSMLLFPLSTQKVSFNWMCHCFIAVQIYFNSLALFKIY